MSQLLPLPLPIEVEAETDVAKVDRSSLEAARNLWSAQLYSLDNEIRDMLKTLMPATSKSLLKDLKKVCVQLANLSAAVATIVVEAVAISMEGSSVNVDFVIDLLTESSVKAAFLALPDASSIVTKHLSLAKPLLDHTVSLQTRMQTTSWTLEQLAEALPDQESLVAIVSAMIENRHPDLATVMRTLSEHDLGLQVIKGCLIKKKAAFFDYLRTLTENKEEKETEVLSGLVQVLFKMIKTSKTLSVAEARALLQWTQAAEEGQEENRLFESVRNLGGVQELIDVLNGGDADDGDEDSGETLTLPAMPTLLEQFSRRTLAIVVSSVDGDEATKMDDKEEDQDLVKDDLVQLVGALLPKDFDIQSQVKQVCDEKSLESERAKKKAAKKKSLLEVKALANKNLISSFKSGGAVSIRGGRSVFHRGPGSQSDRFRSRPPNTSRPPSLHVDDFIVLQSRGQQPTGPTGYNKMSVKAAQELFAEKEAKSKGSIVGFREATKEPVYDPDEQHGPPGGGGGMGMGGGSRGGRSISDSRPPGKSFRHPRGGRGGGIGDYPGGDRRYSGGGGSRSRNGEPLGIRRGVGKDRPKPRGGHGDDRPPRSSRSSLGR